MVSRVSLLVALLGVFVSQNVNADHLPYDPATYRNVLNGAPYYSYCDLPWLSYYEPYLYDNFNAIADTYDIRTSDVYQHHTIIENNMPNLPYSAESPILQTSAAELRRELDRRGVYYLPTPPSCRLDDYPHYPATPSVPVVDTVPVATVPVATVPVATVPVATVPVATVPVATVPVATVPVATVPVLAKRSPIVDTYPPVVPVAPLIDDNTFVPPIDYHSTPIDYDYSHPVDYSSSYDYSLAYRNLYSMIDQSMPYLPRSTYENIRNSVLYNVPPQYQHLADDVASQLTTNIRYTAGMAQRQMPPLYYY